MLKFDKKYIYQNLKYQWKYEVAILFTIHLYIIEG